ncbi:hypothetical protein RhiirB3_429522 [Rhizophagus irregularis]|nr:hypothetical protein RhiirB3_429522 [Rhizophagus irregularis]
MVDDDEVYNDPNLHSKEQDEQEIPDDSKPLDKSITNEKPSLLSDKNSLEISIQPEQLLSLIQSGALSNFNVKINVASNNQ